MKKNGRQRILVVDDSRTDRRYLRKVLSGEGYEIIEASGGAEALSVLDAEKPDLVLLDIVMPGMDGIEVARRIKGSERTSGTPVVMVTSLNKVKDRVEALEAGADDFLNKPVERMELKARVKTLLKVKAYYDHMRDHQKELEVEVERKTEELRKAFEKIKTVSLEAIYLITRAALYKNEGTGAHVRRISLYAAALAEAMGLDETTVEAILYASPMHDVGKIGIPDSILLKQGKLERGEWEIMKRHTIIGAKILESSDTEFMKLGKTIALTHHERWDGNGYPRGLKGTRIPLAGRITALVDVFDALVNERPYKEAFPVDRVLDIIMEERGKHFDPEVTDAFFSVIDRMLSIMNEYKDRDAVTLF